VREPKGEREQGDLSRNEGEELRVNSTALHLACSSRRGGQPTSLPPQIAAPLLIN
jgi:hypothetical protein